MILENENLLNRLLKLQIENKEDMKNNNVIKNNIINIAQKKNVKQNQIARAINMQPSNFSRALNNDETNFTDNQIKEIANFLDVNSKHIFTEYTYLRIAGKENNAWIEWNLPFQEESFLQVSSSLKDVIEQSPNESENVNLQAIEILSAEWDISSEDHNISGASVNHQYLIFDSNRKTVLNDCHNYLCVVSLKQNYKILEKLKKEKKSTNTKRIPNGENLLAEIIIDGDYIILNPYFTKNPNYRIHKDNIILCSPIFYRTMHKNIVKKSSEIIRF